MYLYANLYSLMDSTAPRSHTKYHATNFQNCLDLALYGAFPLLATSLSIWGSATASYITASMGRCLC